MGYFMGQAQGVTLQFRIDKGLRISGDFFRPRKRPGAATFDYRWDNPQSSLMAR